MVCECFDRLPCVHLPHIHFTPGREFRTGSEVSGLIPGRAFRPDAYLPGAYGGKGTVFLFHGNRCHGFQPGHPEHETFCGLSREWGPDAYASTLAQHELYKQHGYCVKFIWQHQYKRNKRKQNSLCILDVLCEA